ncbi:hypothetical protein [Naasia lichenicola]|uniref:TetR/AcrR family transcriptional regulator n=1 Tax=Naasia lichenicola TaxID=2565933 RepID=A0A4S4FI54_9MICO|nr:hypothetical protein [Naasia lichenicola]THG29990.1 hypothetical protein E6C64_15215 [Naasia lichenicola]
MAIDLSTSGQLAPPLLPGDGVRSQWRLTGRLAQALATARDRSARTLERREELLCGVEDLLIRAGVDGMLHADLGRELRTSSGEVERMFGDLDSLFVVLVQRRLEFASLDIDRLHHAAGSGTVEGNVAQYLTRALNPLALHCATLAATRQAVRTALASPRASGVPVLAQLRSGLEQYLGREVELGRLDAELDLRNAAIDLIGAGYREYGRPIRQQPDELDMEEIVEALLTRR